MLRTLASCTAGVAMILAVAGCNNPYDPGQRAAGGALLGAGAGAALGAATGGGGSGALTGALIGGAVGGAAGYATTPTPPPPRRDYYRGY